MIPSKDKRTLSCEEAEHSKELEKVLQGEGEVSWGALQKVTLGSGACKTLLSLNFSLKASGP